jgi:hypothetical protein
MREVDGFTLIDYIKSSIEILMNMKIEDEPGPKNHEFEDFEEEEEREERRRRRKEKKEAKKKAAEAKGEEGKSREQPKRPIPKIDNHTPTSSIIDLQQKLDQISSPTSALSSEDDSSMGTSQASIPFAHKEYERALR